jgi:hypothetical protein
MKPPTALVALGLALAPAAVVDLRADPAPSPPVDERLVRAWESASRYLYNEAHVELETLRRRQPLARSDQVFAAALLLNVQPRTREVLERSERELRAIVAADATDEAGLAARFFLARLLQLHRPSPDPAGAAELLRALFAERPDHPLAQQAAVKLALLDLFPADGTTPPVGALQHHGAVADSLTDGPARRDLQLIVGRAWLYHRDDLPLPRETALRAALHHHAQVHALGNTGVRTRAEVLVALGNLAAELGEVAIARAAYSEFLEHFGRDIRAGTIRQRLHALRPPVP